MGLHAVQDAWAHGSCGWYWVHALDNFSLGKGGLHKHIDEWEWYPPNGQDRKIGTYEATLKYYRDFAGAVK